MVPCLQSATGTVTILLSPFLHMVRCAEPLGFVRHHTVVHVATSPCCLGAKAHWQTGCIATSFLEPLQVMISLCSSWVGRFCTQVDDGIAEAGQPSSAQSPRSCSASLRGRAVCALRPKRARAVRPHGCPPGTADDKLRPWL